MNVGELLPWPRLKGQHSTHPLIRLMSEDDRLRRQARGLADLLNLYAKMLLKLNPTSVRLNDDLEPGAQNVEREALTESRRRELAYAVLNVQEDIRSMCSIAALHEEALGLSELMTTPAGKGAAIGRR